MNTQRLQGQNAIHTHPVITAGQAEQFYWIWKENDGIIKAVHIEREQTSLTVYLEDNTALVFPIAPIVFGEIHPAFARMGRRDPVLAMDSSSTGAFD